MSFLDDEGNELAPDEVGDDLARPRRARVEQWLPDGGAAALTGLVLVLVAWLGAAPLTQAVSTLFHQSDHMFGPTDGSGFGGGGYYGISPNAVVAVSFGTRAALALVALGLGLRARRVQHSTLSGACTASSAVSLGLFVAAAVVMFVGLAQGNQATFYGVF